MTKKSRQKFKYLENEKSFQVEIKSTFIIFKGLSVAKKYQLFHSFHRLARKKKDKQDKSNAFFLKLKALQLLPSFLSWQK